MIALGFSFKNLMPYNFSLREKNILNQLWMYHLLFGLIYYLYIVYGPGGDSLGYYEVSRRLTFSQALEFFMLKGPGTYGMYLLNAFPAKILSFFTLTLLYTLLGYLAFLIYFVLFNDSIQYNSKVGKYSLFPMILFLPNLHFWSAGLGKDTILFLCIACFLYGIRKLKKRLLLIIFSLALSYVIRPHITIFLVAAFGLGFALDGNLKVYQKIFISLIFIGGFALLFDNVMAFLKIEDLSAETLNEFSEAKVSNLSRTSTGSSVDISGYPIPLKILTFLYRPFFFDINGVLAIVASFENLLLLSLSVKFIKSNPIKLFKSGNFFIKGAFLFLTMGVFSFSLILGNLGIMLRQKNMFIPILLFLCLFGISEKYKQSISPY